jgi:hypothetical protein
MSLERLARTTRSMRSACCCWREHFVIDFAGTVALTPLRQKNDPNGARCDSA